VITTYDYLAMVSVCMRLPIGPSLGVGGLYAVELSVLAWMDGSVWAGQLPVKIAYVFLTVVFVSPLVYEARNRFAEVLAGHQAQRSLLHRLLRTGEDERRRIAGELHDRGGGALFSLLHGLRRLRELVEPRDAAAEAEVDRLIKVTEATVHDLRVLLADLRPRLLDDLGLAEALRELLSRERALSGLPVSFEVDAEALPDSESALALYRVAQEAFTNIRRHAHASSANVRLLHVDSGWSLAIEDDGSGLNGNRTGLGLRTMRERVEALGGRLEIHSIQGAGTRISAWVPEASSGEPNGDSSLSR
jgi:signal transduction histidine kinase